MNPLTNFRYTLQDRYAALTAFISSEGERAIIGFRRGGNESPRSVVYHNLTVVGYLVGGYSGFADCRKELGILYQDRVNMGLRKRDCALVYLRRLRNSGDEV